MKILEFDIKKGIFRLELIDLKVDTHSHPTMEVIKAKKGTFSLETDFGRYYDLTFAIIDANTNHKLITQQYEIEVLLIECNNTKLKDFLFKYGIETKEGVNTSSEVKNWDELMNDIFNFSANQNLKLTNDKRVNKCIQIMETENLQYKELTTTLSTRVFLSESRLSHLFKENVGVSIKRYLLWNRLKNALKFLLTEETNLKQASFEAGFSDQAHLTRTFKSFLGINPVKVFNSRTVQL